MLSLAIGIGANTAMFGVVRTLLLAPLPVDAPEELSIVTWRREGKLSIGQNGSTSYRDPDTGARLSSSFSWSIYRAMRTASPAGADLFAFAFVRGMSVALGEQPALVAGGALVDGRYFSALGVPMALGRPLTEGDDRPDAPLAVVLSHAFWMRAYGGDPAVVGRTVRVNGQPAEVVGVTARGFRGLSLGGFFPQTEITAPVAAQPRVQPRMGTGLFGADDVFRLRLMVRVREGTSVAAAQQALGAAMRAQPSPLIGTDGHLPEVRLIPGAQGAQPVRGETARFLYVLLGVVGVVLLIACVNLASLMLARRVARRREMAVRRALGGGRARLARQMVLEALVLAGTGTAAGVLLTFFGRGLLHGLLTGSLGASAFGDLDIQVALDPTVLTASAVLGIGATVAFGLLPAIRLSGANPTAWLGNRSAGACCWRASACTA